MGPAGLAAGTGAAQPATVLTGRNALAGLAAGTGFAPQPGGHNARLATAIAVALQPQIAAAATVVKGRISGISVTGPMQGSAGVSEAAGMTAAVSPAGGIAGNAYASAYGGSYPGSAAGTSSAGVSGNGSSATVGEDAGVTAGVS
jgi:hypothetical protein